MYFGNIDDRDIIPFSHQILNNFELSFPEILTSDLFFIEEIINNSLYRIYPLFYTDTITASNENAKIIENKCILCVYDSDLIISFGDQTNNKIKYLNGDYYMNQGNATFYFYDENLNPVANVEIENIGVSNNKGYLNVELSSITGLTAKYENHEYNISEIMKYGVEICY